MLETFPFSAYPLCRLLLHIADGPRTRRVQPNLTVAPDEGMVNYLRHLLGNPQAVWTE